jgi:hypothetical protein
MKNIIKNLAITFLFVAIMYVLFAFEKDLLLKIVFVLFLLFVADCIWRVVQKERMKNPDYIAKQVAKAIKKWREDGKIWLDRGDIQYIKVDNDIKDIELVYFKIWEKFIHDKNKRLEIVKDWATFVESSVRTLHINVDDVDPDAKKKYDYLQIRIEEIKKRFDKLNKE